jgi:hypothetical protein
MSIVGFILAFLPWLLFLIIAGHSLLTLKIAIIVAFVTSVGMGIARVHRGAILWGGLAFFTFDVIAVVILNNMWAVHHMGVLANGTLFLTVLFTLLIKKPFVLDYAREHVEEKYWHTPAFLRHCNITTSVWCLVFLLNMAMHIVKLSHREIAGWVYEVIQYAMLVSGAIFTNVYAARARKSRAAERDSPQQQADTPA